MLVSGRSVHDRLRMPPRKRVGAVAAATVHRLEPVPKLWYAPQLLRWYVLDSLELDVP